MAALPAIYPEALLSIVEDLRPSEAAGVCGIRPETMRQRLSRARGVHAGRAARSVALERTEAVPSRLSPVAVGAFCLLCAAYVGELVVTAVRLLSR